MADNRYTDSPSSALSGTGWNILEMLRAPAPVQSWATGLSDSIGSWFGGLNQGPKRDLNPFGAMNQFGQNIAQPGRAWAPTSTTPAAIAAKSVSHAEGARGAGTMFPYPSSSMPAPDLTGEATDVVQDFWQKQYDSYIAGLKASEDAVRASYSPAISGLEDEIGDLRAAAAAVGLPFDEYLAARDAIGGDIDAAPGMEGTVKPAVNKIYDDAQGEIKAVMDQINSNFGTEVTTQIAGRVREFEDVIEDVIRTDEGSLDALHARSSEYAQAMAKAAYSNDIYGALAAETRINAELDFKIKETQEDLARQKAARDAALRATRDQWDASFQYEEPTFDQVVSDTWNEYFKKQGVPEHERGKAMGIFGQLASSPGAMLNESSFRRGMNEYFNVANLESLGFSQGMIEDVIGAQAEAGSSKLANALKSYDFADLFQKGQTAQIISAFGGDPRVNDLVKKGTRNADDLMSSKGTMGNHLRNMYTSRSDISNRWEQIIASYGPSINEEDVYSAPGGYKFPIVGGGKYSSSFGYKRSASQRATGKQATHKGIDIMAKRNSPVIAPVGGTVVSMNYDSVGGNFVKVRDSSGKIHYFAHLNNISRNIQPGSKVNAGTVLGGVGNTGNARDTSPHLHYEIRLPNGNRIDPYPWLKSTGA